MRFSSEKYKTFPDTFSLLENSTTQSLKLPEQYSHGPAKGSSERRKAGSVRDTTSGPPSLATVLLSRLRCASSRFISNSSSSISSSFTSEKVWGGGSGQGIVAIGSAAKGETRNGTEFSFLLQITKEMSDGVTIDQNIVVR